MKMRFLLSVVVCTGVTTIVQSRTVALWPLEATSSGTLDGRCVIDPANDLVGSAARQVAVESDLGWNLPPNPDTAPHAFEPVSFSAVRNNLSAQGGNADNRRFLHGEGVGSYILRTVDFTVEGYVKLNALPEKDKYFYVCGTMDDKQSSGHRWQLTFRRRSSENYAASWILWANGGSDKLLFADADEAASLARVGQWMHLALVHRKSVDQQDAWTLYIDGKQVGTTQNQTCNVSSAPDTGSFDIGARGSNDNPMDATFDYWRLSDTMLGPDEFLCAGSAGRVVQASRTVAY